LKQDFATSMWLRAKTMN